MGSFACELFLLGATSAEPSVIHRMRFHPASLAICDANELEKSLEHFLLQGVNTLRLILQNGMTVQSWCATGLC